MIVFGLWILTVPISTSLRSIPASPDKALSKRPRPVSTVTPVDCKLSLSFSQYAERVCAELPNSPSSLSNPAYADGATTLLAALTQNTYYCTITVEPDAPIDRYNASAFKFKWTKRGEYMIIKVPKETSAKLTIEFYENCNTCTSGNSGVAIYRYSGKLDWGQPVAIAGLQYIGLKSCL